MVEESEVKKKENERSSNGRKLGGSRIGAILVLIIAVGVTFLYTHKGKSCPCIQDSIKYTGIVEDCCCDYETVDTINGAVLHPLLQELVTTPFFRYFKVKLWCDCPFWPDDGMCKLRDCSVCECSENEFPESFRRLPLPADDLKCQEGKPEAAVDRTLDSKVFRGWIEVDNPWTNDDETDNGEMTYVNLLLNLERYTGYTGPSSRRIWDAVYSENCPK
ncbi:endoplasmic reticulum oxidoreductin-1-like [Capsicum annuum]|uniref:endoplasmic reticulum oxidoreductin-1-like n=1 Tax=Capsicum annuum TaxID=4072 RepID=UPI001FB0AC0C|nr:endoplasmic reticulum oxidoreductin-1-like [Capsicum annuum]